MKKVILFFLFAVLSICLSAELHYFLPRNNAVMSILDHKYWFEGDTIINDTRYTKVYRQKCESETECSELSYYAAVREDTIGAKIYAVYPCNSQDSAMLQYSPYLCDEVLLADFDVQAGDQIVVYSYWPGLNERSVTVESVDSIWIDNQYRKRINIAGDWVWGVRDYWVEGFGSIIFGLFFPTPVTIIDLGSYPQFLCLHINGELFYQNPDYDICFIPNWMFIPSIALQEGKIYYSIVNDLLYIQDNYTCRIYDVRGSLVLPDTRSSATINISNWTTGIYLIQLYDNNKLVYSGKFIKH